MIKQSVVTMVKIGSDVKKCQCCGGVLSFREDRGFCRECEKDVGDAVRNHSKGRNYGKKQGTISV